MLTTKRWDAGSLAGPGEEMYRWIERLYPLCRSITGPGVEETLALLQEQVPLSIERVPSGTQVFDWFVPSEWTIRDAYVKDSSGRRVIDFRASNLHVLSYSRPVLKQVSLAESLSMRSRIAARSSSLATSRPTDMTSASIAPLASISRSVPSLVPLNGQYLQYHTSADDLTFVAPLALRNP